MLSGNSRYVTIVLLLAIVTGAALGAVWIPGGDGQTPQPTTETETGEETGSGTDPTEPINETPEPIIYREEGGPGFTTFQQTWTVEPNWTRVLIRFTILATDPFITASTDSSASLTINGDTICSPSNGFTASSSPSQHVLYVEKTRNSHEGNCNGSFAPGNWTLRTETEGTTGNWVREFIVEY